MRRVKPQPQVPEVVSQSSYRGFLPKISLGSTPKPRAKPKATPKQGNSMRVPFLPMIRTEVAKVSSENLVSKMCRSKDKADVVLPPIARGLGGPVQVKDRLFAPPNPRRMRMKFMPSHAEFKSSLEKTT